MKYSCLALALVASIVVIPAASAQEGRPVLASGQPSKVSTLPAQPPAVEELYAAMWRNASTPVRDWVTEQAANARSSTGSPSTLDPTLRASIKTRFAGQGLDESSSTMLVFLVLKNAADESAAEYARQATTLGRIEEALTTMAKLAGTLRAATQQSLTVDSTLPCRSPLCTGFAGNAASIRVMRSELGLPITTIDGPIATVGQLRTRTAQMDSLIAEMQDRLDKQSVVVERVAAQHTELIKILDTSAKTSLNLRSSTLRNLK